MSLEFLSLLPLNSFSLPIASLEVLEVSRRFSSTDQWEIENHSMRGSVLSTFGMIIQFKWLLLLR
jgi:hypothetical protein